MPTSPRQHFSGNSDGVYTLYDRTLRSSYVVHLFGDFGGAECTLGFVEDGLFHPYLNTWGTAVTEPMSVTLLTGNRANVSLQVTNSSETTDFNVNMLPLD